MTFEVMINEMKRGQDILNLTSVFKALLTQGSIIPLHLIDNEQYLGMNTITGSLMKTKGLITNISSPSIISVSHHALKSCLFDVVR